MNDAELPAEIEGFTLTLRLDATLTVDGAGARSDWLKPGSEVATRWRGLPDEEQVKLAYRFMAEGILAPTLEELIGTIQKRLMESRRG